MATVRSIILGTALAALLGTPGAARGRQPEDARDGYPDYNRLEMHPKPINPPPPAEQKAPPPPADMAPKPPLNFPFHPTQDTDEVPKPPPPPVPVPDGAAEPPLPDDMLDTLVPSTTPQVEPSTTTQP